MRAVIIGGGKIGAYLARELRQDRTPVIVIERRADRAAEVSTATDALVIAGDGTDLALLEGIDLRPSDFVIALTGTDEDNLVACQLVRTAFGVSRVLARLNDPKNGRTFSALQIPVVSVTDLLVSVISREIDITELVQGAILDLGEIETLEVVVPEDAPVREVRRLGLPESTVVVAVTRDDTVFVPSGDSEIMASDQVLVVTHTTMREAARASVTGEPAQPPPVRDTEA